MHRNLYNTLKEGKTATKSNRSTSKYRHHIIAWCFYFLEACKLSPFTVLFYFFFNHKQTLEGPICLIFHVNTACLYSPVSDFDQRATALIQANVLSWYSMINKQYVLGGNALSAVFLESYVSKFKFKIVSNSRSFGWLYSELQTELQ